MNEKVAILRGFLNRKTGLEEISPSVDKLVQFRLKLCLPGSQKLDSKSHFSISRETNKLNCLHHSSLGR